jgi:phage-related minor tail protein
VDSLTEQIQAILDEQKARYETLRRILLRQAACLRRDDILGVGTATVEVREVVDRVSALEVRLNPLVARWREHPAGEGDRVHERAEAIRELLVELQDMKSQNECLARSAMGRRRQEMAALSAGANAARGYIPRPSNEARFVDRLR